MSSEKSAAVSEPTVKPRAKQRERSAQKPRKVPRYNVLLWDDDDHSYEYVIRMMQEVFACEPEKGFQIAEEVDTTGRVICLTTTLEHAELKRDQIHAFGRDEVIARCQGSMSATIEPVD
jgi:ATP-dependent Clp protease adaptor protein ClpS